MQLLQNKEKEIMKSVYEKPEIEVIALDLKDTITTSEDTWGDEPG